MGTASPRQHRASCRSRGGARPHLARPPGRRRGYRRVRDPHRLPLLRPWQAARGSQTRSARDALVQTIELAEAAEELGLDGAFVRVHHFARQLASPFPLLAAIGARTSRIEIGTGVIDMRYENPLYMAEDAGGRRPHQRRPAAARHQPRLARARAARRRGVRPRAARGRRPTPTWRAGTPAMFRAAIGGAGVVRSDPAMTGIDAPLPVQPQSPGLADRIWWGSGTRATARVDGRAGHEPHELDAADRGHGRAVRRAAGRADRDLPPAWAEAGWEREPRVSVSRSVIPIVSDLDRAYFGGGGGRRSDQVGFLDGVRSRGSGAATSASPTSSPRSWPRRRRARGGHAAAHGPQPARRRVQRAPARDDRRARAPAVGWQPAPRR